MSLLREIQNAAANEQVSVASLLRKCKILAARLKNEQFSEWVDRELNGYTDENELPPYRKMTRVESEGHFVGSFGRQIRNAPIPTGVLPAKWQDFVKEEWFLNGVSVYEDLLEAPDKPGSFKTPWPANLLLLVGEEIFEDWNCLEAWKVIPRGAVVELVESVRNRVLAFALEIERENPEAGEALPNETPVEPAVVSQVFNTQIYGSVGNIASGSSHVSQAAQVLAAGDLGELRKRLAEIGVPDVDLLELEAAANEGDNPSGTKAERVGAWLGKLVSKAASGTWQVSQNVASAVLPKLIGQYLGLPPG